MTGRIWWNRITNPAQFIEEVSDEVMSSESVILRVPEKLPWEDEFLETLQTGLERYAVRSVNIHDARGIDSPGEYLLNKYFSEAERNKCWMPTYHTFENFMAQNSETVMNQRYICIHNIEPDKIQDWINSVNTYLSCINDEKDERAIFILIINKSGDIDTGGLKEYRYSDYVTDFDCLLLCQTILSSRKFTTIQTEYIAYLAFNIAGSDYELAGQFAGYGIELARHPYRTAEVVYNEKNIKVTNLKDKINSALWNTQIKTIFPKMETERRAIVEKYRSELKKALPIRSATGEKIENPLELEIGQILLLVKKRNIANWKDYNMLKIMKEARNALAHLEAVTFTELEDMEIF